MLARALACSLAALIAACASSAPAPEPPASEPTSSTQQTLCTSDGTCWQCQDVPVQNGTKSHCDTPCGDADGDAYECPDDTDGDGRCPPSRAKPGKDRKADAGAPSPSKGRGDAKADKEKKGGGGFKCKVEGGKRECDSPPACAPGPHAAPCGACVPDACDSCECGGGQAGGGQPGGGQPDGGAGGGGSQTGTPGGSGNGGCTLTQGFWKNHPGAWPVDTLTIGGVSYTKALLLGIFGTPPRGDASVILAHQLIAALLNGASGAGQANVSSAINNAQAWMAANKDADGRLPYGVRSGAASQAAVSLADALDRYNNGRVGVPHCD